MAVAAEIGGGGAGDGTGGAGAGGGSGTGGAGAAGGAGAGGNGTGNGAATFTWGELPATHVDLLKSKGMYDNPVEGARKLADSYYNANKALSGASDVLPVPADWTKNEDVEKFYGKLRPETPDKYDIKFPTDNAPSEALQGFTKKFLHSLGVPAARAQGAYDQWHAFAVEQGKLYEAQQAKNNDDGVKAYRQKVGEAVYNGNMAKAQTVFKALAGKGQISQATLQAVESNIGSLALIELMSAIGAGMGEANFMGGGGGGPPTDPSQMSQQQAAAEIEKLQGDQDFNKAYLDAKHPQHEASVQRMKMLFEARVRRPA